MGLYGCEFVCMNQGKWGSVTVSLYVWTRANGVLLVYMCEPGQMGLCDCEFVCVNQGKWGSVTVSLYVWTRANGLCDCEFVCVIRASGALSL